MYGGSLPHGYITDIVHGKLNRCIRVGSMCVDLANLAQVILPDGLTFRQEVREGGSWNYKHEASTESEGLNSPTYIRQALLRYCMHGSNTVKLRPEFRLGGKRCGNVWFQLGSEVGFHAQNSSLRVGRIVGPRKGWIVIDAWIPRGEVTRSSRHKSGLQNLMKPAIA